MAENSKLLRMLCLAMVFPAATAMADENKLPRIDDIVGAEWHRVPGPASGKSVLDVGIPGSWRDSFVGSPTVDFDGKLYRMWFAGGQTTSDAGVPYGVYERIGMATSNDGVNWQLANGGRPVLDLGPADSCDSKGLSHPFVLRDGGTYMMWYAAVDGTKAGGLGLRPAHVRVERVCLATSTDGINWTRANGGNAVMNIGAPGSIDSIQTNGMAIVKTGANFNMWYGAYNGLHTIGTASSPDGMNWTKTNSGRPVTGLKGSQQLGPAVYFDGQKYFMTYCSLQTAGSGGLWVISAATSRDGFNWNQVKDGNPLLSIAAPAGNFDSADGAVGNNHSVHPTKIIFTNGRARMWYVGEDNSAAHHQRIGLMEALDEGLNIDAREED